jgi:hypothetical protein
MRLPLIFGCSVVMLVSAACSSSTSAPVAEGDATIQFTGCIYNGAEISKPGAAPSADNYGGTVLDGSTGGYHVSCLVSQKGAYVVDAHIESPDMTTLSVVSSDVNAGAQMSFFVAGTGGTQEVIVSTDSNNKAAATCTLTTSSTSGQFVVKPGTIFAEYDCPTVANVTNLSASCHASGFFYFTHCGT